MPQPAGPALGTTVKPIQLSSPDAYHIPSWRGLTDPGKLDVIRNIVLTEGQDPRIATLAVNIVREAGVKPRDYQNQAGAILRWVQRNVYYVNEPGERLQSPEYTLRVRYGDCDDMAILLASLYQSLRLPWRFVLSGRKNGQTVRWIEKTPFKRGVSWSHIYVVVGWPPFQPKEWRYAEPTLSGVPLGWDVVQAARASQAPILPELAGVDTGPAPDPRPLTLASIVQDVRREMTPRRLIVGMVVGVVLSSATGFVLKGARKLFRKAKR